MRHLFHFDLKPKGNYGDAILFELARQVVQRLRRSGEVPRHRQHQPAPSGRARASSPG